MMKNKADRSRGLLANWQLGLIIWVGERLNRQGEPCRQQFRCRGSSPCVEWKKGAFHFRRKRTKRVTTEREEEKTGAARHHKDSEYISKAHRKGPIGTSHRGHPAIITITPTTLERVYIGLVHFY